MTTRAEIEAALAAPTACDTGMCSHDYQNHCERERRHIELERVQVEWLLAELQQRDELLREAAVYIEAPVCAHYTETGLVARIHALLERGGA